jgi:dimethylargininase
VSSRVRPGAAVYFARMRIAYVRSPSPQLERCELSFVSRVPIDAARARAQHAAYVAALGALGCELQWLTPLPEQPDAVFVEDTAVVVPELTVITRPGVASRRPEVESVATALATRTPLARVHAPGTLEGGDVLQIGRNFYVGASARSNADGLAQLATALGPLGYRVAAVPMRGCLHLKSAVTCIAADTILVNPQWIDAAQLGARRVLEVAPEEPFGANTLTVAGVTLVSADYPRTRERLEAAGISTQALDVSELHKAEAALTCMSLIL